MILDIKGNSDWIGAFASGLCIIHCLATPFLFVLQSCSVGKSCCDGAPLWYSYLDYVFIVITFFAVYFSSKNTSKNLMKYSLIVSWAVLSILVLNEKAGIFDLRPFVKYIVSFILIGLHLINMRYCQCKDEGCCIQY